MFPSTSSQVQNPAYPGPPPSTGTPTLVHEGPPEMSIRLKAGPAPKVQKRPLRQHPTILASLPAAGIGWSEDGVGFLPFGEKKKTIRPSLATGFSCGSWLFPFTATCKHPTSSPSQSASLARDSDAV